MLRFSSPSSTLTIPARPRSVFLQRIPSAQRNFSPSMAAYKPNTEPPKGIKIIRNIYNIASDSNKFRRVLWTGRNSQVSPTPATYIFY